MKVVYLGYVVDPDKCEYYSGVSIAGNKMQYNIIDSLCREKAVEIAVVNVRPVASFPKEKKIFFGRKKSIFGNGIRVVDVPFVNIPFVKQFMQAFFVFREAQRIYKKNPASILMSFNMYFQVGLPMRKIIEKYRCKSACILADPPINYLYSKKGIGKVIRDWSVRNAKKNILACTNYIVLNKYAVERFAPDSRYVVVEGGINPAEYQTAGLCQYDGGERNVVYTGALTEYSGILLLVNAMKELQNLDISLQVFGDGVLKEYIIDLIKDIPHVNYCGTLPNDKVLIEQRRAWLLVNPRSSSDPIGEVSFPSKIFEYLMSGRPTLVTKSNCYPDEYKDILFFCETNDSAGFASAIKRIAKISNEELTQMGKKAKEFALREKTWDVQADKIYKFLDSI